MNNPSVRYPDITHRPKVMHAPPPYDPQISDGSEIKEARAGALIMTPFMAQVMFTMLPLHNCKAIRTAATCGNRIYLNREYFDAQTLEIRVSILAHETLHAILMHIPRGLEHEINGLCGQPFIHGLYNVAADFLINALLRDMNLPLRDSWLWRDPADAEKMTETIYEELLENAEIRQEPGEGGEGEGSSAGGDEEGTGGDGNPGESEGSSGDTGTTAGQGQDAHIYAEPERSEIEWRQTIEAAAVAAKSQGQMPGSLERLISQVMEPVVDWRAQLRSEVQKSGDKEDRSWSRLSRRHLAQQDLCLPGLLGYASGVVAVITDSSGSVGPDETQAYMNELSGILEDARPTRLIYMSCDARVHEASVVDEAEPAEMGGFDVSQYRNIGGGGTSFVPPFEWLEERGIEPDFLIYLTDGYGTFPPEPPFHTIWVITTDVVSPVGKTIRLTM